MFFDSFPLVTVRIQIMFYPLISIEMRYSDNTNALIYPTRARTQPCGFGQINSALVLFSPHHLNSDKGVIQ